MQAGKAKGMSGAWVNISIRSALLRLFSSLLRLFSRLPFLFALLFRCLVVLFPLLHSATLLLSLTGASSCLAHSGFAMMLESGGGGDHHREAEAGGDADLPLSSAASLSAFSMLAGLFFAVSSLGHLFNLRGVMGSMAAACAGGFLLLYFGLTRTPEQLIAAGDAVNLLLSPAETVLFPASLACVTRGFSSSLYMLAAARHLGRTWAEMIRGLRALSRGGLSTLVALVGNR